LFAGLNYVVSEDVPRVEIRLVPQDVPATVPVEVPIERVVERVVYVPVDRTETAPQTAIAALPVQDGAAPVPVSEVAARDESEPPDARSGGPEPAAPATEPVAASEVAAGAPPAPGLVAIGSRVTPPVAPRAAAPVPVRRWVPTVEPAEEAVEEVVAEVVEDEPAAEPVAEVEPAGEEPPVRRPAIVSVAMFHDGERFVDTGDTVADVRGPEPEAAPPARASQPAPEPAPAAEADEEPAAEESAAVASRENVADAGSADAGSDDAAPEPQQ
jgi:hypothetical protein